uniref:Ubiquitin-activating enzyme SCCH domain-containing protein n=1 Tax=Strombidium inclinatum TaxID=197538 RepID=A0A7S3MYM4_9SPIT|mmetsp:Transcript_29495/g.44817  ORF Transcript_29495/g.44817 Transcript_29495/m.44817 type:complete len:304 (+) Transcript_29495:934-1845(+)
MLRTDNFEAFGSLEFDKDIDGAVEFVTAATNLRAQNFSIPLESLFKIKEVAGKIVPAISSSNAMAASLQVFEAIKLLTEDYKSLRGIVYQRTNDTVRLNSYARVNDMPKTDCASCSHDESIAVVKAKSLSSVTLSELTKFMMEGKQFGLSGSSYMIEFKGMILFEFDEEQDDDEKELEGKKLPKTLLELGFEKYSNLSLFGANLNEEDIRITVELLEDPSIPTDLVLEKIRIAPPAPKKKEEAPTEATKPSSSEVEVSDDDSLGEIQPYDDEKTTTPAKLLGKRSPPLSEQACWDGTKVAKIE